jgi:hypothetical protein
MANKNTKAANNSPEARKRVKTGKPCRTDFFIIKDGVQIKNPENKHKSPRKHGKPSGKKRDSAD